jgi:hypothetical protein
MPLYSVKTHFAGALPPLTVIIAFAPLLVEGNSRVLPSAPGASLDHCPETK